MTELSSTELRENFNHFDGNSDGKIDFAEFAHLMAALETAASDEELAIGFQAIDTDGSGQVELDEFSNWFNSR